MSIPLPQPKWGTFKEDFIEFRISQGQLRARDQEIVRCVREAIAQEFDRRAPPGTGFYTPEEPAEIIRALEFHHE